MEGTLARAREVLRGRDFRRLVAARLTSQIGDGLFQAVLVASVVFSPEKQSTTVGFAKAVAILAVPFSVLGPFAGVFIDRWRRRAILTRVPLLRAGAALLVIGGTSPAVAFYAGALVVLSANRFFLTTVGAVTPRLVPSGDLLIANSISVVGGTLATFVGIFVGSQLSDAAGSAPVVLTTIAVWTVASFLASRIRADLAPRRPRPEGPLSHDMARVGRELRDGARRMFHTPRALAPVTSITLDQFLQGLILVISLVVFRERFRQGVGSFSWLVAAGGVGLVMGLGTVGFLESRMSRRAILALAFIVSGVPLVAVAPFIGRATVLVASLLLGLSFAWKKIPVDTMTQEAIPDAYRGRVFAIYDVAYNMARVVAALIAIGLLQAVSAATAVAAAGIVYLLWIPVLTRWLRNAATIKVHTYSGSRADESPRTVEIGGVEQPVEVERSWREDRAGVRLLCFRLVLPDGTRIEVSRQEEGLRWRLDRELPA